MFNSEDFKKFEKGYQYTLRSQEFYLIEKFKYDTLPLRVINRALRLAVDETLYKYRVETLSDVPFGKGYFDMRERLLELLEQSKKRVEE
jgi:hypothetical protein